MKIWNVYKSYKKSQNILKITSYQESDYQYKVKYSDHRVNFGITKKKKQNSILLKTNWFCVKIHVFKTFLVYPYYFENNCEFWLITSKTRLNYLPTYLYVSF